MIPADGALKRQALHGPLILREHRRLRRARVDDVRVRVLGQRDRGACQEGVRQALIVDVHLAIVSPEVALVPELQGVGAGHIRRRKRIGCPARDVVQPALRPVRKGVHDGRRRGGGRDGDVVDVEDANQVLGRVRVALAAAPLIVAGADAGFEEQLVGDRRRPMPLHHALRVELAEAVRFGRGRRRRRAAERGCARALAADRLFIPHERELVARRRLIGDARRVVLPRVIRVGRLAENRGVRPRVRIACVLVEVQIQRVLPLPLFADAHEVPQLVLYDRPADRAVDVVHVEHRRRLRDTACRQLRRVVARLHALREARCEEQARQLVAALLRDDVDGEAGRLRLAEAA